MEARTVRIGLLVVLVVAGAIFAVVKLSENGNSDANGSGPVGLSESELVAAAPGLDHVAYWVGPEPGVSQYELTSTPDGRIYIRYLVNAQPGDPSANFLSVGTYAVPGAANALREAESAGGTKGIKKGNGYEALQGGNGLSVYVVFDDQPDLQIEVYDPRPGNALKFVQAGQLQPLS